MDIGGGECRHEDGERVLPCHQQLVVQTSKKKKKNGYIKPAYIMGHI